MLADLVDVTTEDGIPLNGAYLAPSIAARRSRIDCLCFFHGDGGHFYRPLYLELGARLAAQGIAFLSANRRGHDLVANGVRGGALQGYATNRLAMPGSTTQPGSRCCAPEATPRSPWPVIAAGRSERFTPNRNGTSKISRR